MADNTTFTPGTGASASTDQLAGGEHVPHVKVMDGTADSAVVLKVVAEDAAHTTGDTGLVAMVVRKDTATALAGADGDYIPLIVDSTGRLHIANADLVTLAGAVAVEGAALPTAAMVIAADDGTDTHLLQVDANGNLKAVMQAGTAAIGKLAANSGVDIGDVDVTSSSGQAAEAAALPGVFFVVAGDDGTDTHPLQVDSNGFLKAVLQAGTAAIGKLGANSGVDIGDVDVKSIAAGENVVGLVGAADTVVTITPVVAAEAHTGGDLLFDSTEIASAVRANGYTAIVESITIKDKGDQKAGMTLIFANAVTDFGVPGGVPDPDDTDLLTVLGTVAVVAGDYVDLGANAVATISNIGLLLKAGGATTSLYMAAITNETPTPASTSDYVIDVSFLRS